MIDPASIIVQFNSVLGLAKRTRDVAKKLQNAEVDNAFADLLIELAELKSGYAEVLAEKAGLATEVVRLKAQLADAHSQAEKTRSEAVKRATASIAGNRFEAEMVAILKLLDSRHENPLNLDELARHVKKSTSVTEIILSELYDMNYVIIQRSMARKTTYKIASAGTKLLLERGLLS